MSNRRLPFSISACVLAACVPLVAAGQLLPHRGIEMLGAFSGGGASGSRLQGQGYLGIDIRDISDSEAGALRLKDSRGAEIIMVDHDGPAGKAGLREHDVVLSVNGTLIEGEEDLRKLLRELQPGRPISMVVCRSGAEQTVNAVMANRAELERQAWEQHWTVPEPVREEGIAAAPAAKSSFGHGFMSGHLLPMAPAYTGATVDVLGVQLAGFFGVKDGKGLLVHAVDENSPAALAGLHAGDVVTRVNGDHIGTKSEWNRALHDSKGHPVSLLVVRDRHEMTLTMVPDAKHRSEVETPPPPGRSWLSILLLR